MSQAIAALAARGIPTIGAASLDAFLAPAGDEAPHALLFFTGDPEQRLEALDVAVVLPQLLAAFPGQLRAGVVAREDESLLKPRFHVLVLPSLVLTRGGVPLGVMPRIYDWSDYVATLQRLMRAPGPDTEPPSLSASGAYASSRLEAGA